ncbi:unnamed protein product [Penicillium bialowiezense]
MRAPSAYTYISPSHPYYSDGTPEAYKYTSSKQSYNSSGTRPARGIPVDAEEYIRRDTRSHPRSEYTYEQPDHRGKKVRFADSPQFQRETRSRSPEPDRPSQSGIRYEERRPQDAAPKSSYERQRRPYHSSTPTHPSQTAPPRREQAVPPRASTVYVETRKPRVYTDGMRDMQASARHTSKRNVLRPLPRWGAVLC